MMTVSIGHFVFVFAIVLTLTLMSGRAYAVCANPAGVAGEVMYNSSNHVLQYCDNTNWISMAMTRTGAEPVVAFEDFEGGASGWSDNSTDSTEAANFTEFLGRFGDSNGAQDVSKTYTLSGDQTKVIIEFDFYQIDSWDAEPFKVFINDVEELSHNYADGGDTPSPGGGDLINAATGTYTASSNSGNGVHLGFDSSTSNFHDGIHHYTITVNTSATSIKLGFGIDTDESLANESYGIDNVAIGGTGDITTGLVSHWKMDETSGNAVDSVSGHTATLANGAAWTASGKINGALDLDGTDDYAETASHADYSLISKSISAWVYIPTSVPAGYMTILEHNRGGNNMYGMWKHTTGPFSFQWASWGGTPSINGTTTSVADTWYHVVGTFDNATADGKIYINGVADNQTETNGKIPTAVLDDIRIGRTNDDIEPWKGRFDDVRIYNRALTAKDVATLYDFEGCTNPTAPEGEIFYNSTSHVSQYCNDKGWIPMGPVPGTGGAGCSNPAGVEGEMMYNTTSSVAQYCDGTNWRGIGK